ncbi:hypothetical protein BaRGS_00026931 [Batillaria attramentaria]|uniref:Uncharacterized protein n=1 Tax=Batillaria attramentaria TaxID=370345 RepID=A0ABD0K408_9CAEN
MALCRHADKYVSNGLPVDDLHVRLSFACEHVYDYGSQLCLSASCSLEDVVRELDTCFKTATSSEIISEEYMSVENHTGTPGHARGNTFKELLHGYHDLKLTYRYPGSCFNDCLLIDYTNIGGLEIFDHCSDEHVCTLKDIPHTIHPNGDKIKCVYADGEKFNNESIFSETDLMTGSNIKTNLTASCVCVKNQQFEPENKLSEHIQYANKIAIGFPPGSVSHCCIIKYSDSKHKSLLSCPFLETKRFVTGSPCCNCTLVENEHFETENSLKRTCFCVTNKHPATRITHMNSFLHSAEKRNGDANIDIDSCLQVTNTNIETEKDASDGYLCVENTNFETGSTISERMANSSLEKDYNLPDSCCLYVANKNFETKSLFSESCLRHVNANFKTENNLFEKCLSVANENVETENKFQTNTFSWQMKTMKQKTVFQTDTLLLQMKVLKQKTIFQRDTFSWQKKALKLKIAFQTDTFL